MTFPSGATASFGAGADGGNTRVTGKSLASAGADASKGTYGSLKNARAMLGEGLRSGSAMTAKGKWDSSFGVGGGSGRGGDMAYGRSSGLVKLDVIKKGEVDNLKMDDNKSLDVPEVKGFKADKDAAAEDPVLQKAKESAEDALKKNIASAGIGAIGDSLTKDGKSGEDGSGGSPVDSGSCNLDDGPPTPLCSAALDKQNKLPTDKSVDYKQLGTASNGDKIYEISYNGTGPGITEEFKGKDVDYSDKVTVQMNSKGEVKILSWQKPPQEQLAANIGN